MPDLTPEEAWSKNTKYDPSMNKIMMDMFEKGRKDVEIAAVLGVTVGTLKEWGKRYDDVGFILDMGETKSKAYWYDIIRQAAFKQIDLDFNSLKLRVKSQFREEFVLSDGSSGTTVNVNTNTLNLTDEQAKQRLQYLLEKKKEELE